jgi:hypothetical protein
MTDETTMSANRQQTTSRAPNGGQWECRALGDDNPMVSIQITLPESMRAELFLAVQEIFSGGLARTQQLEHDRESVRAAAMRGLETLAKTLHRHKGTGQTTRIARFLGAIYNGYEYTFDLIDLRALDTELANACLAYLNYDRLGIDEVHEHLTGGGEQLNCWLAESGLTRKSQKG